MGHLFPRSIASANRTHGWLYLVQLRVTCIFVGELLFLCAEGAA
jgi:hypothetical protein